MDDVLTLPLAAAAVLAILYIVPLIFYGVASRFVDMPAPEKTGPARFLTGILITKLGTAIAFVALYRLDERLWSTGPAVYVVIWLGMFIASEVGDAVSGRSSRAEALIGIASEVVYLPLAAWAMVAILG